MGANKQKYTRTGERDLGELVPLLDGDDLRQDLLEHREEAGRHNPVQAQPVYLLRLCCLQPGRWWVGRYDQRVEGSVFKVASTATADTQASARAALSTHAPEVADPFLRVDGAAHDAKEVGPAARAALVLEVGEALAEGSAKGHVGGAGHPNQGLVPVAPRVGQDGHQALASLAVLHAGVVPPICVLVEVQNLYE